MASKVRKNKIHFKGRMLNIGVDMHKQSWRITALVEREIVLAGSTCATLFDGPVAGLIAGASIELGKSSLNLAERKHAFNKLKRDHDLAYIIEAKDRLENACFH